MPVTGQGLDGDVSAHHPLLGRGRPAIRAHGWVGFPGKDGPECLVWGSAGSAGPLTRALEPPWAPPSDTILLGKGFDLWVLGTQRRPGLRLGVCAPGLPALRASGPCLEGEPGGLILDLGAGELAGALGPRKAWMGSEKDAVQSPLECLGVLGRGWWQGARRGTVGLCGVADTAYRPPQSFFAKALFLGVKLAL